MRLALKLPLLLVASVAAASTVAGTLAVRLATTSVTNQVVDANVHAVHAYAAGIATHLDDAALVLEATGREDEILTALSAGARTGPGGSPEPDRRVARAILGQSRIFEYIMLLRPDGSVLMIETAASEPVLLPDGLGYTAWFRKLRDTGRAVFSDLHISPSTQRPTVVIASPVHDDAGVLAGVWAGALRLEALSEFGRVGAKGGAPSSYGLVTDGRGLIVAHQADPNFVKYQSDFSSVPPVKAALAGREGSGRWVNPLDGDAKLGAYLPLADSGWTAVYATRSAVALAPVRRLAGIIVWVSVGVALGFGALGAGLSRRLVRPLRRLADATGRVAAGDLDHHIRESGGGEVAELAARFNAMVTTLATTDADRRHQAARLEEANAELESFAYSVSHDLRAPLRGIDGFGAILVEDYGAALDDDGREYLARIRAATQRMGRLIDDLLKLSRVGRAELVRQPVDLSELAGRIAGELRRADPSRAVTFTVAPGLEVDADPALAEVALANLLGNAWKFTSKTPEAALEFGTGGPGCFFVRDNGAGFDMTYATKLFGAFQRLHTAADFEGTGIGLATVKRIVQRHGGWVRARSVVGRGATFVFTLTDGVPPPDHPDDPDVADPPRAPRPPPPPDAKNREP